jgi:hypothetical protein
MTVADDNRIYCIHRKPKIAETRASARSQQEVHGLQQIFETDNQELKGTQLNYILTVCRHTM